MLRGVCKPGVVSNFPSGVCVLHCSIEGSPFPEEVSKNSHTLTEVKNVRELRYTKQLQDYLEWCEKYNYTFVLITRRNTVLDKRLQDLIRQGRIIHKPTL